MTAFSSVHYPGELVSIRKVRTSRSPACNPYLNFNGFHYLPDGLLEEEGVLQILGQPPLQPQCGLLRGTTMSLTLEDVSSRLWGNTQPPFSREVGLVN